MSLTGIRNWIRELISVPEQEEEEYEAAPIDAPADIPVPPPEPAENQAIEHMDIQFAEQFTHLGGRFVYCETQLELVHQVAALMRQNGWNYYLPLEEGIHDFFLYYTGIEQPSLPMQQCDVAISFCEALVAEDGSVMLNTQQASQRTLQEFPKGHIILTDSTDVKALREEAYDDFKRRFDDLVPFVLPFPEHDAVSAYKSLGIVLNAEGPLDNYVFYCDEAF